MKISIIVAVAQDRAIGAQNDLLWHLPADLKRFAQTTTGHPIIMGRNTFESLPKGALPNRRNIVISRTLSTAPIDTELFTSLEEALAQLRRELPQDEEVFVIGGAQLYAHALPYADKLYYTEVHHHFPEADTFFPAFDLKDWEELEQHHFPADERNAYRTTLHIYQRQNSTYL